MLRFSASSSKPESQDLPPVSKPVEAHPLDPLTGGAFSAPTSGERSARIREWLATEPSPEQIQEVFKDMSVKDKGAAKALREKLDEIKRQKGQESLAREWAAKGQLLVDAPKLNIADALAWQRDAAKAGAPLSREPLAGLKQALAERVKGIEDLQHRVQVQREAAVLLAQRIEVLSTKSWKDAEAALDSLRVDTLAWQGQAADLLVMPAWASVDAKFPPPARRIESTVVGGLVRIRGCIIPSCGCGCGCRGPVAPGSGLGRRTGAAAGSRDGVSGGQQAHSTCYT